MEYKARKIQWKEGGSIQNRIAEAQVTIPVVGEGATELMYTDRHAYFVTSVSKDGKNVTIQRAKTKCLDYYAGSYHVEPDPEGGEVKLRYRYNRWMYSYEEFGKTKWNRFNVKFGVAQEYQDPHFCPRPHCMTRQ